MLKVHKSKIVRGMAALAALSAGAVAIIGTASPAGADPKWPTALVGHGSDTTQDVVGALAGEESGTFYDPVTSSVDSGAKVLNSWDATGSNCITPRPSGVQIQRGNGSTNGRRILSRAVDSGLWGDGSCGPARTPSGLVDFARSSAGPSGSSTDTRLTYIPFARDAMSFGYAVAPGVTPVTTLTAAQLTQIMTTDGGVVISGTRILGCGIQTGSGTFQFWNQALGLATGAEDAGTADCNAAAPAGRIQENDGNGLKAKSNSLPNVQVIVGFSAANYIAQNNGAVVSQLPASNGVLLGSIDGIGIPYTGTPGNPSVDITPRQAFYESTTFGRDVYNVVSTSRVGGPVNSNADLKTMFVGATSAVCQATATIATFGFLPITNCGSTTLRGPLVS